MSGAKKTILDGCPGRRELFWTFCRQDRGSTSAIPVITSLVGKTAGGQHDYTRMPVSLMLSVVAFLALNFSPWSWSCRGAPTWADTEDSGRRSGHLPAMQALGRT